MQKLFIFLLVLMPRLVLGQEAHPILQSFNAYKQSNGVFLRWVIKGGNQCNGTKVFRASDDLVFEEVNHIPGICGSFNQNETYSFFDSLPHPNRYNHYKLELGFQGFSQAVTVFFEDFGEEQFLVLGAARSQTVRILFSNDQNQPMTFEVFDLGGKLIYSEMGNDSDFEFDPSAFRPGIHVFRILGTTGSDISGKLYFGAE